MVLLREKHWKSHLLWFGIPFGLARHGEALVERKGDEGAGSLICDGGQLLNWEVNSRAHIEIKDPAQALHPVKERFICYSAASKPGSSNKTQHLFCCSEETLCNRGFVFHLLTEEVKRPGHLTWFNLRHLNTQVGKQYTTMSVFVLI